MRRPLAYVMSLIVVGSSVWTPTAVFGQVVPGGSPMGSSSGGTTLPVTDAQTVIKGSADATKLLRFEVDGFTTGTTRVLTPPNADGTIAVLGTAQSWTAAQTFGSRFSGITDITIVTTTATTSAATGFNLYTNTGDADGATITLQDNPTAGGSWDFAITAAQTLTIVASTGESIVHAGTTCGTSLSSNTVGSTIRIRVAIAGSGGAFYTFGSEGTWVCTP